MSVSTESFGGKGGAKVAAEVKFYFWTGIVLYVTNTILYTIDYAQRYSGWQPDRYAGLAAALAVNLFLIANVRLMRSWARNLFLAKFVVFALFFYPQTFILPSGSYMYSSHFPHGVLERMSNFGNLAYEALFAWYLLKRSVRYAFTHQKD